VIFRVIGQPEISNHTGSKRETEEQATAPWSPTVREEHSLRAMFEISPAETMKNVVFWDKRTKFVPHRKHITSPLQSPSD
jgi:hypothetical protein